MVINITFACLAAMFEYFPTHTINRSGEKTVWVPILLIWDDCSAHWSPAVTSYAESINVSLRKVPPHATSVCQPATLRG